MEKIEDLTYKAQQRQRQGRTLEAIRLFEQALEHRIDLHGPESSSVRKACDNLSDVLNGAALKHLQSEDYEEAKKLLQKAEMLSGPDDLISAVRDATAIADANGAAIAYAVHRGGAAHGGCRGLRRAIRSKFRRMRRASQRERPPHVHDTHHDLREGSDDRGQHQHHQRCG